MKFNVLPALLSVLMTLGLTGCGKKASDVKPGAPKEEVVDKTESALVEETHRDLLSAILASDIDKIKSLLENKLQVNLNKILENGETLMTTAVAKDLYQVVELLLENKADLLISNSKKQTPLMIAAELGLENLTRLLISYGSKTDAKDANGNTALHLAIINKHESVALLLINSKSNIHITNDVDQTPLNLAEILAQDKVVELLRSKIQLIVGQPSKSDVANIISLGDAEDIDQLFFRYPSLVNEYRDLNYYVLIMRSKPHDMALTMTYRMIIHEADLDGPAGSEVSPLIEAVKHKYEDFVTLMLNKNVNPNILDSKGLSALIWAIKGNSYPIVKSLLNKRALEKYNYYENGQRKTMKACDVVREMKKVNTSPEDIKSNEDITDYLGCRSWSL